jgi:hypothetical protein
MGKKSRSGSGMNFLSYFRELRTIFWIKILDADADLDPGIFLTLDPGWEKSGSGMNIADLQHCRREFQISYESKLGSGITLKTRI